jgi:signal transduction histidine kinase
MVHTPAGTRVVIRARRHGDRGELSVEDNGPGIPSHHREAVFGRFYRVDGGKASGSGLGLAIARELARLMGGVVRLDSDSDPTVFTLDLPARAAPDPQSAATPFSRENDAHQTERAPQAS